MKVINEKGISFEIKLDKEEPTVKIYDTRDGQMVSSYYIDTFLYHDKGSGLSLWGSIDDWSLSWKNVREIQDYLKQEKSHDSSEI